MNLNVVKCEHCGSNKYYSLSYGGGNYTMECRVCNKTSRGKFECIEVPFPTIVFPNGDIIKNLSDEIAAKICIVELKNVSTETLVRMVSEGRLKNTICSEELAKKLQKQYPNIDISLALGFNQNHGWLVNINSPQLLEKLNYFLTDFMGSTAYWELYRKYN